MIERPRYYNWEDVVEDIDSLKLELEAEKHNHRKDNEFLIAQRDHFREALEHLAHPNWATKPVGLDAVTMAQYAQRALDEYREDPYDNEDHGLDVKRRAG